MKNQSGLSLLEVLFSLAVTAVIMVTVINHFLTQNQRYLQVSQVAAQIQQLASVSYEWQTAQQLPDFTELTLQKLLNAGLLINSNFNTLSPWGSQITLTPDPKDAHYLQITVPKIPNEACANLSDKMTTIAHAQTSATDCNSGEYQISL